MPSYVKITRQEMEKVLKRFSLVSLTGTYELVYGKRVDVDGLALSLRVYSSIEPGVYSSIEPDGGLGRGCGEDAIRVSVWYRRSDGNVIRVGESKRINRVPGWDTRLRLRINEWWKLLGPKCPKCGVPTVTRKGPKGKFYGCSSYPECRMTVSIKEEEAPKKKVCSTCGGHGTVRDHWTCPDSEGFEGGVCPACNGVGSLTN